jgi:uncharacterized RDD family membrane protein YckC
MSDNAELLGGSELASLSARLLAQFIDGLIAFGFLLCGALLIDSNDGIAIASLLLGVAYYLLADGLLRGQSLAKRLLGIVVVDAESGAPCGFVRSFLRNISQLLSVFDWLWIFGSTRRRLGDWLAQTRVIRI